MPRIRRPASAEEARFSKGEQAPVSAVSRGEAKILQIGGEKAGVYRDYEGEVHAVSPVCTHMGSSTGTGPSAPGTARATGRASTRTAACSGAPPRRT